MSDTSIRVTAESKKRLELLKRAGESYDDVIMRLTSRDSWAGFGIASGDPEATRNGMDEIRRSMRREMAADIEETR